MNGIRPDPSGYDIIVNGIERSHRDMKEAAYDAATFIKKRWPSERVVIREAIIFAARVRCCYHVRSIISPRSSAF
jgi:hypothetical protein